MSLFVNEHDMHVYTVPLPQAQIRSTSLQITLVCPTTGVSDRSGHAQIQPMAASLRANSNNHKWGL